MSLIRDAWREVWRRRDLRPIYEWARDNTDLRPPLTKTGPFDVSISRHFIAPLDALADDRVRAVNVLKPVRGGGTLLADIWIPWARVNDPGPTMFVLQTDPIADDHFTKILMPTMESVPEISRLLSTLERFETTKRKIEFSDGNHLHVNGPAIGNLQTNAFRYVIEDECWLYPDKMADAEARVGDFARDRLSKILRISQGGPKEFLELDQCSWKRAFDRGWLHEWEVACLHCGQYYRPIFSGQNPDGSFWGITWDHHKTPSGDWHLRRCAESVRFECPHCHKPVLDTARTKSEWNRTGRYQAGEDANPEAKSFHWENVITDIWTEQVELWLDACNAERRGDLRPKIQFYQKRRAMFMDEPTLLKGGMNFRRARYEIESEWQDEKARFLTVDRQEEDIYWWTVRAWGSNGRSRKLGFGRAHGPAELVEIAERFKIQTFLSTNGTSTGVGIDSGYAPKGDRGVYNLAIKNGWLALKGDQKYEFIHRTKAGRIIRKSFADLTWGDPESGTAEEGRRYCPLLLYSKAQLNEVVQNLIDAGLWEEPENPADPDMEKEYSIQMSGRIRKTDLNKRTGETRVFWFETKNDHARDLANMQALLAMLAELLPDPVQERLTRTEKRAE